MFCSNKQHRTTRKSTHFSRFSWCVVHFSSARLFWCVCLPFGGFCGFPFHLENMLNDTHLLNMLKISSLSLFSSSLCRVYVLARAEHSKKRQPRSERWEVSKFRSQTKWMDGWAREWWWRKEEETHREQTMLNVRSLVWVINWWCNYRVPGFRPSLGTTRDGVYMYVIIIFCC